MGNHAVSHLKDARLFYKKYHRGLKISKIKNKLRTIIALEYEKLSSLPSPSLYLLKTILNSKITNTGSISLVLKKRDYIFQKDEDPRKCW